MRGADMCLEISHPVWRVSLARALAKSGCDRLLVQNEALAFEGIVNRAKSIIKQTYIKFMQLESGRESKKGTNSITCAFVTSVVGVDCRKL